jgi:hypothetical protein
MSILNVRLKNILQLFYADDRFRRSLLLADIRSYARKDGGGNGSSGGDFYGPFWADAKSHANGALDLTSQTEERIARNKRRARLYPLLKDAALELFNDRLRWVNEPREIRIDTLNGHFEIPEIAAKVRVENVMFARVGADVGERNYLIYPYFSEKPSLPEEGARLGLWAMSTALSNYPPTHTRIVDLLRRALFSSATHPPVGDERDIFLRRYQALILEREILKKGR